MSQALPGEHYCEKHQGNHSHYDPRNCTVCKLEAKVQELTPRFSGLDIQAPIQQLLEDHKRLQRRNAELEAGQQAAIDGYIEPIAHMYPSDLKRFETQETYATAYSVAVGNPNESSRPLYSEATVQALQAKVRELEEQNAALSDAEVKRFAAYEESERLAAENAELRAEAKNQTLEKRIAELEESAKLAWDNAKIIEKARQEEMAKRDALQAELQQLKEAKQHGEPKPTR